MVRPASPVCPPRRWPLRALAVLALACGLAGCVKIYQPLGGLNAPRVVQPDAPHFAWLRIDVFCVPGPALTAIEAQVLCRRVGAALEAQGATVRTEARARRVALPTADSPAGPPADLVLELRGRVNERKRYPLSWTAFALTFTLAPGVDEQRIGHEVEVRDGRGHLLAVERFDARFVEQTGVGVWVGHRVMDALVRAPADRLGRDAYKRHFSDDYYGALSQILVNAQLRATALAPRPLPGLGP